MGSFAAEPIVFVTGASRSGTTMVTRMLGRHSAIAGLEEMHYFGEFCDPRRDRSDKPVNAREAVGRMFARQSEGVVASRGRCSADPGVERVVNGLPAHAGAAEIFAATLAAFAARAGKTLPCEQTPRNIYYARALLEWFPEARFVHMLRDPRAVMASQKFRWRRRSLLADPLKISRRHQLQTWVNYHPYTVTQLWTSATRLALELEAHPRFHLLKLEDLIVEPERRLAEVCDFLGVTFEPGMLDIEHVNSSYVSSASAPRGVSRDALDAWRGKLSREEEAIVYRRCARLMSRVGYEPEPASVSPFGLAGTGLRYVAHVGSAALVNPRRMWIQGLALLRGAGRVPPAANGEPADVPAPEGDEARRVPVLGLSCTDTPPAAAARHLVACAIEGQRRRVYFVNAHSVNVAARDPRLREALGAADILYADGAGMAMAARLQGERLAYNVNGTDLFPHLCAEAAAAGVPIALLGAAPGVVDGCVRALAERYPALRVAWAHHGFVVPADTGRIVEEINASGARVLLVAMGVPRQELWIADHAAALQVPVVLGVGGLFDFVSGRVPRAPLALRRLRLEWLFRLAVEPRRLFGRYVIGNPAFLARAVRHALTGPSAPATSRGVTPR